MPAGKALCNRLAGWAASVAGDITETWPKMPAGIEDRNADVAAVRGASAAPPAEKEPDYGKMSNEEFRAAQLRHGYSTI